MHEDYILEAEGVSKAFSGVTALDNVMLKVKRGTVHTLMGENGAGKSTLMKILLGIYQRDAGIIRFDNEEVRFKGAANALKSGLAMIHQELSNVRELTVFENIFLGKELTYGKSIFSRQKKMRAEAEKLFQDLDIDIDVNKKMKELSVAQQQMCEIAKAISYNAKLIIMDEPTSAITESEVEHLFRMIGNLKKDHVSVIYITHKMDEVFQISDDITVLRDGRYIDTLPADECSGRKLISLMVGREITDLFPKSEAEIGEPYLRVENLSRKGEFSGVSFEVRRGEILGVAGLMGAGRKEVMETIFGIRKKTTGKIFVGEREAVIRSPRDAIKYKIALLTEDRKESGCFLPLSVRTNISIASIKKYVRLGLVRKKQVDADALGMKDKMSISTPSLDKKIMYLSGGNQQKVLVGRWLLTNPEILIVDEPTRGIDVGAKAEIHRLLSALAQEGKCIIMISSELPEVIGMSDRVMVMSDGRMAGILEKEEVSQEKIMLYATGETQVRGGS